MTITDYESILKILDKEEQHYKYLSEIADSPVIKKDLIHRMTLIRYIRFYMADLKEAERSGTSVIEIKKIC